MIAWNEWVAFLVLAGLLALAYNRRARAWANSLRPLRALGGISLRFTQGWRYWLLFALALGVGVFVRVWRVPELPRGIFADGAQSASVAISLWKDGADRYGNTYPAFLQVWGAGQMSVLFPWMQAAAFALLGVSRLTILLPMLIVSLIALPVWWDMARRMLGKRFALLALWMLAICPWQIVQSRWAIDCHLMSHFFLFSVYLLYIGLRRRPFLYLSMIFFGLTMYTYAVSLYIVPVFLLAVCTYLLRARRLRPWEALACAGAYLATAWPFLLTILINVFGWQTLHIGPVTLQRFESMNRQGSILFFAEDVWRKFLEQLISLVDVILQQRRDSRFMHGDTRTLYAFSVPALLAGVYLLWRGHRPARAPLLPSARRDSYTLLFFWLCVAVLLGLISGLPIWRINILFYPLLFGLCVALQRAIRSVRGFAPLVALLYAMGFIAFFQGYFYDETYIGSVGSTFRDGYYEAAQHIYTMDCDRYYIYLLEENLEHTEHTEAMIITAHQITGRQWRGEAPVNNPFGDGTEYYADRYVLENYRDFDPDPMECAAYLVAQKNKRLFDPQDYILQDFGLYATAYPRYWAEE
ncbi:MAG: glycosyltransferase family 39 protein [Oscillospiraceae bacterium]|jgi:hypothetical protein|nr:glycosyltransferase family 39 protein [Oscillospiraceae bacterium]